MATQEELAAQKATEEAAKKAAEDELDPEVEAISKDPKAVKALLEAKRAANAEAKKLRLAAEEASKAEKTKQDAALAEQGKYKELLEKAQGENAAIKSASIKRLVDLHLKIEAKAAGAVDEDAVVALVNRPDIKVGDDFEVTGIKEAVEALKKAKPNLFGNVDPKVAPPKSGVPAPRGGFSTGIDVTKMSARELMAKGLEKK